MRLNAFPVNTNTVNGTPSYTLNTLITIGKDVQRLSTYSGSVLTVGKDVQAASVSRPLISIGKNIINNALNTFYKRNGWEPIITIGYQAVLADELTGGITVAMNEGSNTTASFTVILSPDVYNLYEYQGQPVTISVRQAGVVYLLFTGLVDVPVINIFEEKLTLNCVSDRRVLLDAMGAVEPYIGYYSDNVLGTNINIVDRITQRMTTIPYSLDFDGGNNYSITSWTAKSTPDFSYGSSSVYRRNPQLTMDSAGQLINTVNLTLDYGYVRHHQAQCTYTWRHPYCPSDITAGTGNVCPFLFDRPTVPSRQMILSAAQSSGWLVDESAMYFGSHFKSGFYYCSGAWLAWSTVETGTLTVPILNSNGAPETDSSGNILYRSVTTTVADNAKKYTLYSQFYTYKRYNQNVKESYVLSLTAPDSVSRYGTVAAAQNYGYNGVDAYPEWTNISAYDKNQGGVISINGDTDRAEFNTMYLCAIHKAQTQILKSHRRNKITFQRPLTPNMNLSHTVALTGKWVRGRGKVSSLTHYMGVSDSNDALGGEAYTDITLLQYRGDSVVSDTALTVASKPSQSTSAGSFGIQLGTHLGEDPSTTVAASWNGYVGNTWNLVNTAGIGKNYVRTTYQESFIVDAPTIPSSLNGNKTISTSASYIVNIPNDNTVYESYG